VPTAERDTRRSSRLPVLALAALLVVGSAVLLYETRGTTFWADEWNWILTRRGGGVGTFLDPHNEHLTLVPVVIYKLLFATVGLHHYWPYRVVLVAAQLACVALVFVYARPRVGGYLALLGAALIIFFGPGWQDILWPFQMAWLIAIAAGIGALLLLERHDRAGDIGACVLLGISLASSGPGLAVAVGLVVEVLLRRRPRDLWIVGIPIGLYLLWWLGYQNATFNRHALVLLPRFVADAAAGALSALTGLASIDVFHDTGSYLAWGAPLLAVGLIAAGWRLYRLGRIPGRVLTLSATVLGFWVLTGVGRAYASLGPIVLTATGDESRYLYVGAVFVVLLCAELARSYSPPRVYTPSLGVGIGAGVLAVAAVVSNLGVLRDGSRLLQSQAQITEAELGTLDVTRAFVKPGYLSNGFIFLLAPAGQLFAAEKALGSVAASPLQIAAFPDYAREAADSQLIKIGELQLQGHGAVTSGSSGMPPKVDAVEAGTVSVSGGCLNFRPSIYTPSGEANAVQVTVPAGGLRLRIPTAPATVSARRFSVQFEALGTLSPPSGASLTVLPDAAAVPWHVRVAVDGPVSVCSSG
jgi:hypothetical protein